MYSGSILRDFKSNAQGTFAANGQEFERQFSQEESQNEAGRQPKAKDPFAGLELLDDIPMDVYALERAALDV